MKSQPSSPLHIEDTEEDIKIDPTDPNFDSRDRYIQREIRKTKKLIEQFRFERQQFDTYLARWQKNSWPVAQLMRDHYGSKILDDNNIFETCS